jgi:hypothetical protein
MDTSGKKFYISQLFAPWNTQNKDMHVQLNPRTAILQHEAKLRAQQFIRLTTVIFIMVGIVAVKYLGQSQQTATQASFNLKRSVIGSVTSIDVQKDSMSLAYISSPDPKIHDAKINIWVIQLIPGKSVMKSQSSARACFLTDNLNGNLAEATPADCNKVIVVGRKIIADYVFLNIPMKSMVVRTIIGLNK